MFSIPRDTLVAVVDGARARLFRNRGSAQGLQLQEIEDLLPVLDYEGRSGHLAAASSTRENDEAAFGKQIAQSLYQRAHNGEYEQLVLVADPDSLGEIRASLHKEVRERLLLEVPKELTRADAARIEQTLQSEIEARR